MRKINRRDLVFSNGYLRDVPAVNGCKNVGNVPGPISVGGSECVTSACTEKSFDPNNQSDYDYAHPALVRTALPVQGYFAQIFVHSRWLFPAISSVPL